MALEEITAALWVIGEVVAGKSLSVWLLGMQLPLQQVQELISCFPFSCSQSLSKLPAGTLLEPCV